MKVEVIKGVKHSVELNFGDTSVCINTDEAQNLITQLRAVVPVPADIREAEIKKINITPSEVRYVIDAIPGYAGIFMTEDDAKKGLAIFKAGAERQRERQASLPTIKGWMARDGHGSLVFSNEKPSRLEWCGWKLWKISRDTPAVVLPNTLFPDLRWEDEPREVEIIIKEVGK